MAVHTYYGTEKVRVIDLLNFQDVYATTTNTYRPESNGLDERTHGIIIPLARSCIDNENFPHHLWNHTKINVVKALNVVIHSKAKKILSEYDLVISLLTYHKKFHSSVVSCIGQ